MSPDIPMYDIKWMISLTTYIGSSWYQPKEPLLSNLLNVLLFSSYQLNAAWRRSPYSIDIFKDISPVTFGTSSDQTSPEQPTKTLYDWLEIDSYLYKLNLIVVHQRSQLVGKVLHILSHRIIPTWSKHA